MTPDRKLTFIEKEEKLLVTDGLNGLSIPLNTPCTLEDHKEILQKIYAMGYEQGYNDASK